MDNSTEQNSLIAFLSAAQRSEKLSQGMLNDALQLVTSSSVSRRLKSVLKGDTIVRHQAPFYFLGEQNSVLEQALFKALDYLEQQGLSIDSTLIVDVGLTQRELSAMVELKENAYYLLVSANESGDHFSHAIHELVHTILRSGNRFLDEAAAYYYELKSTGAFPEKAKLEARSFASDYLDIATLISYEAGNDPFFQQLEPSHKFSVHALGALTFAYFVDKKGLASVVQFYKSHKVAHFSADSLNLVMDWLQETPPSVQALLGENANQSCQAELSMSYPEVEKAFVIGELESLKHEYLALFSHYKNQGCDATSLQESEMLVLVSVAVQEAFKSSLSYKELAFVTSRVALYLQGKSEDWRHYQLFKVMVNLLSLPFEGSMLDAMLNIDEAKLSLKNSLEKDPDDMVSAVFLSRLIWNSPSESLIDKQEAIDLLKPVSQKAVFSDQVGQLINAMETSLQEEACA